MDVARGSDCGPVSIPTLHPLHRRSPARRAAALREADLVLVAECDVPWIPRAVAPAEGAVVVHLDPEPLKATMPLWAFPIDHALQADGATALAQLVQVLERRAAEDPLARGCAELVDTGGVGAVAEPPGLGALPEDPGSGSSRPTSSPRSTRCCATRTSWWRRR